MKILFITTREFDYPRNQMLLRSLRSIGDVTVIGNSNRGALAWRSLSYTLQAIPILLQKSYDLIFVGFYGQLLMLPLGLFSRAPLLFDAYLSTYDTLCFDRKIFFPHSLPGWLAFQLDRWSCENAARVLLDTDAQKKYFESTFSLPPEKIVSIFVGCDERIFFPRLEVEETPVVLFYGSYLPLHGVDTIVRAARLLRDELPLRFELIGAGSALGWVKQLAGDLQASNVDFLPPVPLNSLPDAIGQAMICLGGHFGSSDKAGRVIAGKTFQCLAMAKPVIVGDNTANRELLTHGQDAWFCAMHDPQALANAIRTLYQDRELRISIGREALATFEKKASFSVLSQQVGQIVNEILGR